MGRKGGGGDVIVSTSGAAPSGLTGFLRDSMSFDDARLHVLPTLTDGLDARSAGFNRLIRNGGTVRLGRSSAFRMMQT